MQSSSQEDPPEGTSGPKPVSQAIPVSKPSGGTNIASSSSPTSSFFMSLGQRLWNTTSTVDPPATPPPTQSSPSLSETDSRPPAAEREPAVTNATSPSNNSFSLLSYLWPQRELKGSLVVQASTKGKKVALHVPASAALAETSTVSSDTLAPEAVIFDRLVKELNLCSGEAQELLRHQLYDTISQIVASKLTSVGQSSSEEESKGANLSVFISAGIDTKLAVEALHQADNDIQAAVDIIVNRVALGTQVAVPLSARLLDELHICASPPYDFRLVSYRLPSFFGQLRNVRILRLERHELSAFPTELLALSTIEELYMKSNRIKSLPNEIDSLSRLKILTLSDNQLAVLPPKIAALTQLRQLDLDQNQLYVIPSLLSLTNLTRLDLRLNKLVDVSTTLLAPHLKLLYLDGNLVRSITTDLASPNSGPGPALELSSLSLVSNRIAATSIASSVFPLLSGSLTHLDLSRNTLATLPHEIGLLSTLRKLVVREAGLTTLPAQLGALLLLESLDLSKNSLTAIPSTLLSLRRLNTLDISENKVSAEGLTPALSPDTPPLRTLVASGNPLGPRFAPIPTHPLADQAAKASSEVHPSELLWDALPSTLESLELNSCDLDNVGKSIQRLMLLKKIDLGRNKLSKLPEEFSKLSSLFTVDLNDNPLKSLPLKFSQLLSLRELRICNIRIAQDAFGLKNASLIDSQATNYKIGRLVALCRTSSHPDLIFALHHVAALPVYQVKLVEKGITQELVRLTRGWLSNVPLHTLQLIEYTLRTLELLVHVPKNRVRISAEPDLVACLLDSATKLSELASAEPPNSPQPTDTLSQSVWSPSQTTGSTIAMPTTLRTAREAADVLQSIIFDILTMLAFDEDVRSHMNKNQPQELKLVSVVQDVWESSCKRLAELASSAPATEATPQAQTTNFRLAASCRRVLWSVGLSGRLLDEVVPASLQRTQPAPAPASAPRSLRILTIDGGGTRGYVAVRILCHLERRLGRKISDMFDLVVGTSAGSLIASMLVARQMEAAEMAPQYRELCIRAFVPHGVKPVATSSTPGPRSGSMGPTVTSPPLASTPLAASPASAAATPTSTSSSLTSYIFGGSFDKIFTVTNLLRGKAYYQSKPLHHLLKELSGGKHYRLIDITSQTDTRVVIVSVDHSKSPALPYLFRSYNPPTAASRYHGTCQTPLWQALRASTAAPGYFDDLPLDDRRFVDGGIAFNNPAALALHEARALWPNRPLGVLLSIGNGNPRPRKTEHSFTQTLLTVVHACTETEKTHQMLLDLLSPDAYFRLNPEDDSFEWSLDETRPEKFDSLDAAVDAFAEQNSELLQQICDKLSSM